ncbi:MAG: hypothetical protein EA381_07305 [Planctomycetaceae bacterium]|nr:MAG: hypothetical protein EA381_07305 [Planctomycetaceae bacterium]
MFVALAFVAFCHHASYSQERRPSFGERQLEQLIDDRPSMRNVIPVGHPIRLWVVEKFERGALGDRVYWDHHEPIHGAEHVDATPSVLRITRDQDVTGRDKWAMLVFELINFEASAHRRDLERKAIRNEIGRTEFAMDHMRLEVDALRQSQVFFRDHPIPGSMPAIDSFYFSLLGTNTEFGAYLSFLESREAHEYSPLKYFGERYDSLRSWTDYQSNVSR